VLPPHVQGSSRTGATMVDAAGPGGKLASEFLRHFRRRPVGSYRSWVVDLCERAMHLAGRAVATSRVPVGGCMRSGHKAARPRPWNWGRDHTVKGLARRRRSEVWSPFSELAAAPCGSTAAPRLVRSQQAIAARQRAGRRGQGACCRIARTFFARRAGSFAAWAGARSARSWRAPPPRGSRSP